MIRFDENNRIIRDEELVAILVGLQLSVDISYSMDELSGLAEAAGITPAGQLIQSLERPNTATYIGKGKVEELAELCVNMEADLVIFNNELSGMQLRNLEERLSLRVIDRTILILDIFAARAVSREGKLQVELAQLQYRLPRLTGFGKALSRLGGGIGTRGPGEKKLETDRRHITSRMDEIKRELREIKNTRKTQRAQREKAGIPLAALVGYTNSGKSAIMNRFLKESDREEKAVLEKDMLFATLDTFQRRVKLESGQEFILIDTVGFVSRLPHSLVNAFKATLEEVVYADLLLHVIDASYPNHDFHIQVTNQVLKELGAGDKERLLVYNKIDLLSDQDLTPMAGPDRICVSAKYGDHMDELMEMVKDRLFGNRVRTRLLVPFEQGGVVSYLCEKYQVKPEYLEKGAYLEANLSPEDHSRLMPYALERNQEV